MNEKRKRGRPVNEERRKLEEEWGYSARHVQRIIKDMGLDGTEDAGKLRVIERKVSIALRAAQTEHKKYENERQKLLDDGKLISVDFAIERYVGALVDLKNRLADIPDRLCSRLNPENPQEARRILQEELALVTALVVEKAQAV